MNQDLEITLLVRLGPRRAAAICRGWRPELNRAARRKTEELTPRVETQARPLAPALR